MTVTGPVSESYYSFIRDVITACLSWWFIHIMLNVIGCLETNFLHRQGCYCCPSDSEKGAEIQSSEITELRKKARMKWEHECSRVSGSNQSLQHALPPIIETAFRGIASFDVYL